MCPHPGEFAHLKKKKANAWGLAQGRGGGDGGWALLELTDALDLPREELLFLPVYKSIFYGLTRSSKNRPRLIHGSKILSQVPAKQFIQN